jgi:hypothetical protein
VTFDQSQLGFLPQAIGLAVSGYGIVSLSAYDANDNLIATVAPTSIFTPPPPGGDIVFLPPSTAFFGAQYAGGIARFIISSNDAVFQADDLQYGRLVPEPASLCSVAVAACALCLRRKRVD